jgi:hypothetical protein
MIWPMSTLNTNRPEVIVYVQVIMFKFASSTISICGNKNPLSYSALSKPCLLQRKVWPLPGSWEQTSKPLEYSLRYECVCAYLEV